MLLSRISIRDDHIILHDVDGSEVPLTAQDALTFRGWIDNYFDEVIAIAFREQEKRDEQSQ